MKLNERVYFQRLDFDVNLPDGSKSSRMTYAILLKFDLNCLIDSGVVPTMADLHSMLQEADLKAKDLDILINTHCHFDHTGGNHEIKALNPELKVMAHQKGQEFIEFPEKQNAARPVPSYNDLIKAGVKIDRLLQDGDTVDIGTELVVMHTPGHSQDSITIYVPAEKLLIVGDAIPRYGDLPIYDDLKALRSSLQRINDSDYRYMITAFDGLYDRESDPDGANNPVNKALSYLELIDAKVKEIKAEEPALKLEEVTDKLMVAMNLPRKFPPFVYRSVAEHLSSL